MNADKKIFWRARHKTGGLVILSEHFLRSAGLARLVLIKKYMKTMNHYTPGRDNENVSLEFVAAVSLPKQVADTDDDDFDYLTAD